MERSDKHRKVGEQIKRLLAILINREVKDPRLGMVGISGVELSKDKSSATVYITTLKDEQAEDSIIALKSASGYLRRELGRSLKQRTTPRLDFVLDTSIADGARLSQLIDSVNK